MTPKFRSIKSVLRFCGALLLLAAAHAQGAAPPCPVGYTLGFFNGVANTYADALSGLNALKIRTMANADNYNGEDVKYEIFYNHTGGAHDSTILTDVAEVFAQRAQEIDPSGSLSGSNFYLFWDALEGNSGTSYSSTVAAGSSTFNTFLTAFQTTTVSAWVNALASLFSPPTLADYADQKAQLDAEVAAGRKLVLVAHSQGNLFVNQAYDYVQPQIGSNLVKVAHIAPASPTLRGNYLLADIDLVINALRLKDGFGTVPNVNLTIGDFGADPSGHTLIGTYLDRTRPGLAASQSLVAAAFAAISVAACKVTVTPAASQANPGDTLALTAALGAPIDDPDAVVTYQWVVTGNAGGNVTDPVSGTTGTSFESSSSTATYIASANAVSTLQDTITVTVFLGNLLDSSAHKAIGVGTATVSFGNPWVGTFIGSIVSTCGYYSGPLTFVITDIGNSTLHFAYTGNGGLTGGYDSPYSGNVSGGFTLNGNTLTSYAASSCQTGTYTRQ